MISFVIFLVFAVVATSALPTDQVLIKLTDGLRYQYVPDERGQLHLADFWLKTSSLTAASRYDPYIHNTYHLFTRQNPIVSQPLVLYGDAALANSNFNAGRRTYVSLHGWFGSAGASYNALLVNAFLASEDANVLIVDWGVGASTPDYISAIINTVKAGRHVANFINWLNRASGTSPIQYHITGFSLGGQMAGIVGRHVDGGVGIITSLDPANGWSTLDHKFRATDGVYTEVIHTSAGALGTEEPLGQVDVYPNGGFGMPGCGEIEGCDHDRAYKYYAESILSGGFTAVRCDSYQDALNSNCNSTDTIQMGGIVAKTGTTGIFFLETNAESPFSRG